MLVIILCATCLGKIFFSIRYESSFFSLLQEADASHHNGGGDRLRTPLEHLNTNIIITLMLEWYQEILNLVS